jgi:uncharacterized integral membrane protein
MASTPITPATALDQAFVADRQQFWNRFTAFSKWAVIAVIVLLVLLYIFVV